VSLCGATSTSGEAWRLDTQEVSSLSHPMLAARVKWQEGFFFGFFRACIFARAFPSSSTLRRCGEGRARPSWVVSRDFSRDRPPRSRRFPSRRRFPLYTKNSSHSLCDRDLGQDTFVSAPFSSKRATLTAPLSPPNMDSHDGIQKLLAAEQEAQGIVAAARAEKTARLRQAKAEADAEIAAYRAQREEKYQGLVLSQTGDSTTRAARLEADCTAQIATVVAQVQANKKIVTNMLAQKVTAA
jgi:V-type H+-transporting ATPase subunit G